ncbi:MAG: prolyl oligopeptidase family serine peptidase [Flaviflexus sp.]|nr:prolyl oligopeptidase family serine peptidase [Flaviflexus sp.]
MASVSAVSRLEGDEVWVLTSGFLTPTRILHGEAGNELTEIRRAPERFDASGLEVRQLWATSKDGTEIPYYVVGRADNLDGERPARCLLDGYGGFEVANLPSYLSITGAGWLENGGVYALANIRGGGEFGPSWHQAALRSHRHRAYEDFAAVARDLTTRGITTVDRLAATGGSNGGLLMGNMYTTYPELFGALVCRVPLLDMKRFSHLLAGHSWIDEYGDPDTEDWEFLKNYSPYHNVRPADSHPPILLTTSSADDRVHPGHARKFAALLERHGKDMLFWENTEGGHGGAADAKQRAKMLALTYAFLDARLS